MFWSYKFNHNITYLYGVNATLLNFLRIIFRKQFLKTIPSVEINATKGKVVISSNLKELFLFMVLQNQSQYHLLL
jgi:hypothetical protein